MKIKWLALACAPFIVAVMLVLATTRAHVPFWVNGLMCNKPHQVAMTMLRIENENIPFLASVVVTNKEANKEANKKSACGLMTGVYITKGKAVGSFTFLGKHYEVVEVTLYAIQTSRTTIRWIPSLVKQYMMLLVKGHAI